MREKGGICSFGPLAAHYCSNDTKIACEPSNNVSVERTFSKSRHICSDLRGSLKMETISKALSSKVRIGSER